MKEIVNKVLLEGDQFCLKCIYGSPDLGTVLVDHLLKTNKKNSKIQRNRDSTYIYQNELEKAWFQHDMAHGDFIELSRKTSSDKALRDEAFNIAKNPKYDG